MMDLEIQVHKLPVQNCMEIDKLFNIKQHKDVRMKVFGQMMLFVKVQNKEYKLALINHSDNIIVIGKQNASNYFVRLEDLSLDNHLYYMVIPVYYQFYIMGRLEEYVTMVLIPFQLKLLAMNYTEISQQLYHLHKDKDVILTIFGQMM